jgi:hypothetical protein
MAAKRAFISFDFDHDEDLRNLLVGQAKNPDTPFEIHNWSVKEPMTGDWKEKVRTRIRSTDLTIVICGESTHTATGPQSYPSHTKRRNPIFCYGAALTKLARSPPPPRRPTRSTNGRGIT